jgi:hypothetical protein
MIYEIITVEERVLLLDMHRVSQKSRLINIRYKKRIPLKPPEPDIVITENGYLFYRKGGRFFSCPLTERERVLVRALLAAKDYTVDDIFAVFQLDIWKNKDKNTVKNIINGLKRKMRKENMPLTIEQKETQVAKLQSEVNFLQSEVNFLQPESPFSVPSSVVKLPHDQN